MSRRTLRGSAAIALVAAGSVIGPGSPAAAAGSAGYCPDASGVTVVVDFNELGGGTVVRCAPGSQATGLAALKSAGFQITGTLRWGEGFICRIEGKPSAGAEKCVDTPPASAYWSYWHAPNGGNWTYSDKGVLNRTPPAGSFEGWSFSLNRPDDAPRPGVTPSRPAPPPPASPPAPPAPPPASDVPVAPPPAGGAGAPPPADGGQPGATGGPTTVGPSTSATAAPSASAAGFPSPETAAAATRPGSADEPVLTDAVAAREDGGVPLGTLVGVLLLATLAAGGLVAARRRRVADPDD
ncbi:hypothetical protein [Salinispora sp. H7-4]|uniref:hypothetical protein n=1 Tax=Salinispora sp. H7-4 TaxID=2748321 RepID=UPI0015D31BAA|nr:hypothetical protein [Salinispora sp. H7-4]NYT93473.1 hypothetical protein [Salinispora sp. H7-4]